MAGYKIAFGNPYWPLILGALAISALFFFFFTRKKIDDARAAREAAASSQPAGNERVASSPEKTQWSLG